MSINADTQQQREAKTDARSPNIRFRQNSKPLEQRDEADNTAKELDLTELNVPESAKNQPPPAQTRDILSIPIYNDGAKGESVSAFEFPRTPSPPKPDNTLLHLTYNNKRNNPNNLSPAEYAKWWDATTERKKQELQQLDESRKQMEEIEGKLKQNRDLERFLTEGEMTAFPWEEKELEAKGGGRKLLDDFADSLKFVNKLYTAAFGPASRKVPAHMPHMIDKDVMEELQQRWWPQWDATASHRLRHSQDMQYAFAYFYYLIHARVDYNLSRIWEVEFDKDHDGELNDNELRTLGVHLYGAPLKAASLHELKEKLLNTCITMQQADPSYRPPSKDESEEEGSGSPATPHCPITLEVVRNENKTEEEIKKIFSKKLKYRHQIEGTDEVAFLMVGNNDSVVQGKLDGIRSKRQKFICLNDNMNHSASDVDAVVKVLHDLYTALVPMPSSFELPPNVRNAYQYIDEIHAAKAAAQRHRQYNLAVGVMAILGLGCGVYQCWKYASRADRRVRERRAKRLLNTGRIS